MPLGLNILYFLVISTLKTLTHFYSKSIILFWDVDSQTIALTSAPLANKAFTILPPRFPLTHIITIVFLFVRVGFCDIEYQIYISNTLRF